MSDSTSLLPIAFFLGAGIPEDLALSEWGRDSETEQVRKGHSYQEQQQQQQLVRFLLHVGCVVLFPVTLHGTHTS